MFYINTLPAEGGDPPAQLRVAVRAGVIAADEQLHCVIPVSAGQVSLTGTRQRRIELQRVKVQQACRETQGANVSFIKMLNTAGVPFTLRL